MNSIEAFDGKCFIVLCLFEFSFVDAAVLLLFDVWWCMVRKVVDAKGVSSFADWEFDVIYPRVILG